MPKSLDPLGIRHPGRPYSAIVKSGDLVFVWRERARNRTDNQLMSQTMYV